eukprot:PRCOL_00004254-RA
MRVAAGVALFAATKLGVGDHPAATLATLEARAVPFDTALANGRPSLLEFYADWCAECREMAPTVAVAEDAYDRDVNFVMINVDNPQWYGELDEYGVDGIPHFSFLAADDTEKARMVGVMPEEAFKANIRALKDGADSLPYSRRLPGAGADATAAATLADAPPSTPDAGADPRAHG